MALQQTSTNKRKIINDPVHGFITIPSELVFDLIQHPYFQRLRRIKQLGMSHLVYPGANHTRFHHALGAMHLMNKAISVLRKKGVEISPEEKDGAIIAILLHDIGHGPFSHTLEHSLLSSVAHEEMSILFMEELNKEFNGQLSIALQIFKDQHPKKFLHQLVSGQLDMDRLDYLQRDSFFTGVSEGVVGSERIITMLNVREGDLVVEEKGIYSIENFISARRIMYWQVYMHKTVVSSEHMLINILKRAKELYSQDVQLFASPFLARFLKDSVSVDDFKDNKSLLYDFAMLDDSDIISALKIWQNHSDKILSSLCTQIVSRDLFRTEISKNPLDPERVGMLKERLIKKYDLQPDQIHFFLQEEVLINNAYDQKYNPVRILLNNGELQDLAQASDNLNISTLSKPVEKYCLCFSKSALRP